jgi:predicted nucleotidyltransferase component of viral defense system
MNLFDQLVTKAIENQPDLSQLRVVVEKELLHHDILRIMSHENMLADLTFIGGTCLRSCYGGNRLSEDLDFTGGSGFTRASLAEMGRVLTTKLEEKYGLFVKVQEPVKDKKNVDTWKIKVETRPEQKHLPAQRINIDICAVPSYEKTPMLLLNPYGVDMGTSGLIIQAQSREEIYTDKLIAFALRQNHIKYRDLWDIIWLHQQGIKPNIELIPLKLKDRNCTQKQFNKLFSERTELLSENNEHAKAFKKEMQRFLPVKQVAQVLGQDDYWRFVVHLMRGFRVIPPKNK